MLQANVTSVFTQKGNWDLDMCVGEHGGMLEAEIGR